jgi:DNA-binding transcriptional ArsR family regulator
MANKPLTNEQKEALKVLRAVSAGASEVKRKEHVQMRATRKAIKELLAKQPATVAELAEALKLPRDQVFWHLMAMRKYGLVRDEGEDGEYLRYALVTEVSATPPSGH